MSLISSDGICSATELLSSRQKSSNQSEDSNISTSTTNAGNKSIKRLQRMDSSKVDSKDIMNKMKQPASSADTTSSLPLTTSEVKVGECTDCFGHEENLVNNIYGFETNNRTSCAVISENFYPTVIGRSEYGNFKEALYHLEKKLIATRSPEEIRGGGLLKYCNLLVKNYKPTNVYQIRTLERYMCSRFFIDFSDLNQQRAKLESYLANHFSDDPLLKFDYLTVLHNVVQRSTVCLMNHELRLTLNMIRDLAYKLNEQQEQQLQQGHHHQPQQQHHHQQPNQIQQQPKPQSNQHQLQQSNQSPAQQQHYYPQQKPLLIQSGVYRVKLVNYTLAKPPGS